MRMLARQLWARMRYSYWFVPALMVVLAGGLAVALGWVDDRFGDGAVEAFPWIYTGSPEGARSLLSTAASSMITVAGVVFSVTIVALTLASSQFGPRLLRNFMRDTANQVTLGMFLAAFVYCLLVVRTIRGTDTISFVPHVSVSVAVILALLGLTVLILFIHHAASSIQAPNVLASVARDLDQSIDVLFPEETGAGEPSEVEEPVRSSRVLSEDSAEVWAEQSGYVQAIDDAGLLRAAIEYDVVVAVLRRPGDFVVQGQALARVHPRARCKEQLAGELRSAYVIDKQRSVEQDVGFAVEQLVSVAMRALSPGVNDPLTAIQCIDWLSAGLMRLARRRLPRAERLDERGHLRVVAHPTGLPEVLTNVCDLMRPYVCSNPVVVARMNAMLDQIASAAHRESDLVVIAKHRRALELACSGTGSPSSHDRSGTPAG